MSIAEIKEIICHCVSPEKPVIPKQYEVAVAFQQAMLELADGLRNGTIDLTEVIDEDDYCYECTGYGDNYYETDEGEWVSACDGCPHNDIDGEEDE